MLFSRRTPENWQERLRIAVWPRRSWSRSLSYLAKRVLRLSASPHSIALGVAVGIFASFTPFLGFHLAIALALSWLVAGNVIAAATGTLIGNPVTFPLIWAGTYETGRLILWGHDRSGGVHHHMSKLADASLFDIGLSGMLQRIADLWDPVIKPMLVGAVPLGLAFALVFYVATRWATARFQAARRHRLEQRQKALAATSAGGSRPA